jgi:hypothetical protein
MFYMGCLLAMYLNCTLASSFRKLIEISASVYCEVNDQPQPSFPSWQAPREKGGGVVIPCTYIIRHHIKQQAIDIVKEALMDMSEGEFVRLAY